MEEVADGCVGDGGMRWMERWRMEEGGWRCMVDGGVADGGARGRCSAEEARGGSEAEVRGSSKEEGRWRRRGSTGADTGRGGA